MARELALHSTTSTPVSPGPRAAGVPGQRSLSGKEKAAILVRLLIAEGAPFELARLPPDMQAQLAEQVANMRLVDRTTLSHVVGEFVETLDQVGLSFSSGIEGALQALDGKISPEVSTRLRNSARRQAVLDPWQRITQTPVDDLLPIFARESPEVVAVVLSKLPVAQAASLLEGMPGDRARAVAHAISLTESVHPDTVDRIGRSVAGQIEKRPEKAFAAAPAARMGAILNSATAPLRDALLSDLQTADAGFAEHVQKAIFTFAHIHERITPRDVPRILRDAPQDALITALAGALPRTESAEGRSAEFLLGNTSQRMAAQLRDEIESRGKIRPKDADAAMKDVVATIRRLIDDGIVTPIGDDDD